MVALIYQNTKKREKKRKEKTHCTGYYCHKYVESHAKQE